LSEAAKAVIDVECFINQNVPSKNVGRVHNSEARFSEDGPNVVVQKEEVGAGHNSLFMNELVGPRGTKSHAAVRRGMKVLDGSMGSTSHEDEVASPTNSLDGTQMQVVECIQQRWCVKLK